MGRLLLLAALVVLPATTALAQTTVERTVVPSSPSEPFSFLQYGSGQPYFVQDPAGVALPDRARSRRSLAYFAQLSDFQLTDEESPARVEFLDGLHSSLSSAWRPQEALLPHTVDASIRSVNARRKSPVAQGDGARADLGFAVLTGDNADNQHRNETRWVAELLQGRTVKPNSGSDDVPCPGVPGGEAIRYTGVQDYDDYFESDHFYDPDRPIGPWSAWPTYTGLMDRAQKPFNAAGLDVPSYVAIGNHDALAQGNEDAIAPFEAVAVGCVKPMSSALGQDNLASVFSQTLLETSPEKTIDVPADPERAYVTLPEYRAIFGARNDRRAQADAHGFAFVDQQEIDASRGAASYYQFSPAEGLRFIALDTVANGGVTGVTDRGNIDHAQFKWLMRTIETAERAGELIVLYSHHAPASLDANVPDEAAAPCTTPKPEDDPNPGCDLDPRRSEPLHLGPEMVGVLNQHPQVIAWVAGHSHVNDVRHSRGAGAAGAASGFWIIRTSAEADWPHQDRLLEIMDNQDGTLSIFGTLIDNAAPATAPPPGTKAAGMSVDDLASIARTFGFNDPQSDRKAGGEPKDRNVELLLRDPRKLSAQGRTTATRVAVTPSIARQGRRTRVRVRVTRGGRPVRGAVVRVGDRRVRTGRRGRAALRVRFPRIGAYAVRAGGRSATILVTRRG